MRPDRAVPRSLVGPARQVGASVGPIQAQIWHLLQVRSIPVPRPDENDEADDKLPKEIPRRPEVLDPQQACALLREHPNGGEQFWAALRSAGTPLIDTLDDDDTAHRAVTFVHPAGPDVAGVDVLVRSIIEAEFFDDAALRLLPETDVWATTLRLDARRRGTYSLAVAAPDQPPAEVDNWTRARMLPAYHASIEAYLAAFTRAKPDPLATEHMPGGASIMTLPDATPLQWLPEPATDASEPDGVQRTEIEGRPVWSWTPASVDSTKALPIVVFLDGDSWTVDGPTTIAAMIADGSLPPVMAVGVSSNDQPQRWADLCCSETFIDNLATNVLGWANRRHRITNDPARTIVVGQSLGALAAVFATQYLPERFGTALSQSGSFWCPEQREWLTTVIRAIHEPTFGLYLSMGSEESTWITGSGARMIEALTKRGDPLEVRRFVGGHDPACWRADLGDGLASIAKRW